MLTLLIAEDHSGLLARPLVAPAWWASEAVDNDTHARRVGADVRKCRVVLDSELNIRVDTLLKRPECAQGHSLARLFAEALLVDKGDVRQGVVAKRTEPFGFLGAEPVWKWAVAVAGAVGLGFLAGLVGNGFDGNGGVLEMDPPDELRVRNRWPTADVLVLRVGDMP